LELDCDLAASDCHPHLDVHIHRLLPHVAAASDNGRCLAMKNINDQAYKTAKQAALKLAACSPGMSAKEVMAFDLAFCEAERCLNTADEYISQQRQELLDWKHARHYAEDIEDDRNE
jgi:hypothetical protein